MAASGAPQHNLPLQPTSFVGRDQELVELTETLNASRLLTLTGVGGVGKTRLALAVGERVAQSYPDGTWLVELAALADAALVPQFVAAAVSVPVAPGDAPLAALVNYFRPRRALLLLDNCEHLIAACATLVDELLRQCAQLRILATSREALGIGGELHWRVPSLAAPADERLAPDEMGRYPAVQLFVARIQLALPHFSLTAANARPVARICARLDGIPLALELAAARARSLPVEVIAERLDQRFRLLTDGSRTALPRQQTLAATIGWSHDLLMENERRLFRRLAVFAGSWTLDAAERVCGSDGIADWEVLDVLPRLVDKSMVVAEEDTSGINRYRLLETLRQYGDERLAEADERDALRDRHFAHYLALAETAYAEVTAPRERDAWLRRLDAENDNLRAALGWGSQRDPLAALRLAVNLNWYWWYRRRHQEGVRWHEALLDRAPGATQLHARAFANIGLLAREYGDIERAQPTLTDAMARFVALDDRRGQALVLQDLTLLYAGQERMPEARRSGAECLRLHRELGDLPGQTFALAHLGHLAMLDEDVPAASQWYAQSLVLARELGDRFRIMRQCYLLGTARRLLGDRSVAAELFSEAATFLDPEDPLTRAFEWIFPGDLAVDEGQYDHATELYRTALRHFQQVGWRTGMSLMIQRLGILAIRTSDERRGVRILAAAHDIGAVTLRGNDPEVVYERRHALDRARATLGEEPFAAAWASGQALTLEDASLEALTDPSVEQVPSALAGPLTARQFDVADLIARGLTNRQIAEHLFVSPHTVERHVENIPGKLRLSSRTAVAVWVAEHRRG